MKAVYDISIGGIDVRLEDLHNFEGKKILIVNVASANRCIIPYRSLQELYDYYKEKLVIKAVPCNDFGNQEIEDSTTIIGFCRREEGITFPVAEKITIRHNRHPLYNVLCENSENGICNTEVNRNFFKFLLNEKGCLIASFPSFVDPLDESILSLIEN